MWHPGLKISMLTAGQWQGYPCPTQFSHTSRRWPVNQTLLFVRLSEQGNCKWTQWGLTAERDLWTGNGVYAYVCACVWVCITALPVARNVWWHHRWSCSSPVSCPKWEGRMWLMEHDASPVCYADLESVPLRLPGKEVLSDSSTAQRHIGISEAPWIRSVWFKWKKISQIQHRKRSVIDSWAANMLLRGLKLKD